jgi:hypothetical protein
VNLPIGWSGISSFLVPVNQDIPEMFSGIENQLMILYNLDGSIYYPNGNLVPTAPWDMYSGYCIKMEQQILMDFCGDYLQDLNISLSEGWNLIPMLSKNPVSSEIVFGLNNQIIIVKQVAGSNIFWKEMGINTLSVLLPGQAYFVFCSEETSISYPVFSDEAFPDEKPQTNLSSPFGPITPTPSSHVLALPANVISNLNKGDIIGAFNSISVCTGQTIISKLDENVSLSIYSADTYTEEPDGMKNGENISYRLFRPSDDACFDIEFTFGPGYQNGNTFVQEGISVVTDVVLSPLSANKNYINLVDIYPNPTKGILHISGLKGNYLVEVYNTIQKNVHIEEKTGNATLNLTGLPKGIYLVRITNHSITLTKKILIN